MYIDIIYKYIHAHIDIQLYIYAEQAQAYVYVYIYICVYIHMHTTPYNCVCLAFFFNLWVLYVPPAGVGFLQAYLILFPPAASQNQENVKNYDIPPNKRKKRKTSGHRRIEKST